MIWNKITNPFKRKEFYYVVGAWSLAYVAGRMFVANAPVLAVFGVIALASGLGAVAIRAVHSK